MTEQERQNMDEFREQQRHIAEQWLHKGNITDEKNDDTIIFARFFFYFTGFNAMYFLYKEIDNLDGRYTPPKKCPEYKQIEHLLDKFDETTAQKIRNNIEPSIKFFSNRSIQPMNIRNERERKRIAEKNKTNILNSSSVKEKIKALGQAIYNVRCNLYHGSKEASADDQRIVSNCIKPLEVFLEKAIKYENYHKRIT
ncbi:MAG: hypothetical protein ABRQ39_25990 [Candidatus Eremiobacterota bacterium]